MIDRFAACFVDRRDGRLIEHELRTLVGQRVLCIALGYEDLIDHDELRHDPVLAVLAGKLSAKRRCCAPLAGKSTLNRLELSGARPGLYHKIGHRPAAVEAVFVQQFVAAHRTPPAQIVLDLDATDDPLHGHQEGRFFHGYYDGYCYLPLYIFCGRHLLAAKLRRANIDASAGAVDEVARIVRQLRRRWPRVRILLRADSGFAREALMAWCEANRVAAVTSARRTRARRRAAPRVRTPWAPHYPTRALIGANPHDVGLVDCRRFPVSTAALRHMHRTAADDDLGALGTHRLGLAARDHHALRLAASLRAGRLGTDRANVAVRRGMKPLDHVFLVGQAGSEKMHEEGVRRVAGHRHRCRHVALRVAVDDRRRRCPPPDTPPPPLSRLLSPPGGAMPEAGKETGVPADDGPATRVGIEAAAAEAQRRGRGNRSGAGPDSHVSIRQRPQGCFGLILSGGWRGAEWSARDPVGGALFPRRAYCEYRAVGDDRLDYRRRRRWRNWQRGR